MSVTAQFQFGALDLAIANDALNLPPRGDAAHHGDSAHSHGEGLLVPSGLPETSYSDLGGIGPCLSLHDGRSSENQKGEQSTDAFVERIGLPSRGPAAVVRLDGRLADDGRT